MSRYYVFTQAQLEEALDAYYVTKPGGFEDAGTVRCFLASDVCLEMGMTRDLPAPVAPEVSVAAPAHVPEQTP